MTTNTTDEDRTPAQTLATAMRTAVAAQHDLAVLDKTVAYLAGPMTGIEAFNFPAFVTAARELTDLGLRSIRHTAQGTPPDLDEAEPWGNYLRVALRKMLGCDAVVVLPGWRESKGARLEVHVALELGMPVVEYPDLRPVETATRPIGMYIPEGEAPTWDEIKPYLYPATQGGLTIPVHQPDGPKGMDASHAPLVVPSDDETEAEYIERRYGGVDPRTGHHIKPESPSTVTIAGVEFDTTEDPEQ